jgi:NAD(P)H-dependent FMN reductase
MSKSGQQTILVITGILIAVQRSPQIAEWVLSLADATCRLSYEIVDLQEWQFPFEYKPSTHAKGASAYESAQAWSKKIAAAAGFVIVSPNYNWGYPVVLTNALNCLYKEWKGKPLVIVTYGGHDGGKCAEQLRKVAGGLNLQPVDTMPAIMIPREAIRNNSPPSREDLKPFEAIVRQSLAELSTMVADAGGASSYRNVVARIARKHS